MHFSDTCEVNVALCNIRLHHENTLYSKELLYECSHEKRGLEDLLYGKLMLHSLACSENEALTR